MDRKAVEAMTQVPPAVLGPQIGLASAKGSPGVTTLALALGLVWPAPVIVGELDPAGGDLAARLHLPAGLGVDMLASAAREEAGASALIGCLYPATETCSLLLGSPDPMVNAQAVNAVGPGLPLAARAAGVAGLWDLGRLQTPSPACNVLEGCDGVAVVVRSIAGDVAHAVSLVEQLAGAGRNVGVIVASCQRGGRAQSDDRVADAIADRIGVPVTAFGRLPLDPIGVAMLERRVARWAGRSTLGASVRAIVQRLESWWRSTESEPCTDGEPETEEAALVAPAEKVGQR